jgi:tetratricopeptide (TPR) repeat protein
MSLRASLLRQLDNPYLSRNQRAELGCEVARQLEDTGDYEGAREAISEFWREVGERPQVAGLNESAAAEVLLRAGRLTCWLGNNTQAEGAQEQAKNLITEAARIFESLTSPKKVLEAQVELAYCYWQQGEYDEARIILTGVVEKLTADSALKAKAVLRLAIVEGSANRYSDALRILREYAPLFDKVTNHAIKGSYHNELGLVFKNLAAFERREDYLDRAFVEYEAASYQFEQAGHMPYCGYVENNLGFILYKAGKYADAHKHLDRARRIFTSLKDRGSVAQVSDTRARVLLAEGRNEDAEKTARAAVRALEGGGRQSLLAEALTTHGAALARLGMNEHARQSLLRAMEVAYQSGALSNAGEAALTLLEELGEHLAADELQSVYGRALAWLESSRHVETLQRLCRAARRVVTIRWKREDVGAGRVGPLRESVRQHEKKLIRQALQHTDGSVTQAARLLGLSHQNLIAIIETRHRDLLTERKPKAVRRRALFKKRQ